MLDTVWRSQKKSLLRLGRSGVNPSHQNSLAELIRAHHVVRVKVNDDSADMALVSQELVAPREGDEEQAVVLQIRNKEFMVATEQSLQRLAERAKQLKEKKRLEAAAVEGEGERPRRTNE